MNIVINMTLTNDLYAIQDGSHDNLLMTCMMNKMHQLCHLLMTCLLTPYLSIVNSVQFLFMKIYTCTEAISEVIENNDTTLSMKNKYNY